VQSMCVSAAYVLSLDQRLAMMRDAATAIVFLHGRGYMHCDIKSLNFLVDERHRVKLADLGEARPINGPPKHKLPPIPARNWAPPEVLEPGAKADCYTIKSEVFGLAIVLIEVSRCR
jgi:serine/threonine protein kinase